jgi:hypothetical protein
MLHRELQNRKVELQRLLGALSGGVEILRAFEKQGRGGEFSVEFIHSARVRRAKLRLNLYEQFTEIHTIPHLYAFSYHIGDEADVELRTPLFRYECHPELGDPHLRDERPNELSSFESPYSRFPHFHPDNTTPALIRKLHFPFHRGERKRVVFALIEWLQVDLIKRFYSPKGSR